MQDFTGKVAVVTGAAGGIGKALAERCVAEGMKVVLADVEQGALDATTAELKARGGEVLPAICDVSKVEQVKDLADRTIEAFGAVHLLFNNAGVGGGGEIADHTLADWQWVLGVNLMGVIYGVHHFLPIMLAQETECHIINTGSVEGLWTRVGGASYQVAKHGVVALSEVLKQEMLAAESKVGVSVLCPGQVNTGIIESGRNRPPELQNPAVNMEEVTPEMMEQYMRIKKVFTEGMDPAEVADHVFRAIREERFFILTHPELNHVIQKRLDRVLTDGIPTPDFTIADIAEIAQKRE